MERADKKVWKKRGGTRFCLISTNHAAPRTGVTFSGEFAPDGRKGMRAA